VVVDAPIPGAYATGLLPDAPGGAEGEEVLYSKGVRIFADEPGCAREQRGVREKSRFDSTLKLSGLGWIAGLPEMPDYLQYHNKRVDLLFALIAKPSPGEMKDPDRFLCPKIPESWLDFSQRCIAKGRFRIVSAGIQQKRPFESQIISGAHRPQSLVLDGKLIGLAFGDASHRIVPEWLILAALITGNTRRVEVLPFVSQPIVAWMVRSLGDAALGTEMLNLPVHLAEPCFAVSTLTVEKLFESHLDGCVAIDVISNGMCGTVLDGFVSPVLGQPEPVAIRPDRCSRSVGAISLDVDQDGSEPVLRHELLQEAARL